MCYRDQVVSLGADVSDKHECAASEPGNTRELPATLRMLVSSSLGPQAGLKASGETSRCALPGSRDEKILPLVPSPQVRALSQHSRFLLGFHGLELLPCALFMPGFNGLFFHH